MRAERRTPALSVAALTVLIFAASGVPSPVLAVPLQFTVQGRLTDANGVNRDGSFAIAARLWSAASAGTLLYKETKAAVPVANGNFALLVGGAPDADSPKASLDQVFTGTVVYLEFQAAGETPMAPRQPLLSVPYAVRAQSAEDSTPPPGAKQGVLVTVSQTSVRVQAEYLAVGGAALTGVDLTATPPVVPNAWHSVNVVTDAAGAAPFLCVVPGEDQLSAATLASKCGTAARRFRRVGWARGTSGGLFRRVIHTGDYWDYDEELESLLAIQHWSGSWQTYSVAEFLPPTARRASAQMHQNNFSSNITGACVRPTGGRIRRCFDHYGPGSGQSNRGVLQDILTGPNRDIDVVVTSANSAVIWVIGYYDPI